VAFRGNTHTEFVQHMELEEQYSNGGSALGFHTGHPSGCAIKYQSDPACVPENGNFGRAALCKWKLFCTPDTGD
jgi:hypothetical protein